MFYIFWSIDYDIYEPTNQKQATASSSIVGCMQRGRMMDELVLWEHWEKGEDEDDEKNPQMRTPAADVAMTLQ